MRYAIFFVLSLPGFIHADSWTWTVNQAVPDNDPAGFQNTQSVSGYDQVIQEIAVRLHLSGDPLAFGGDLFVSLQSENGGYAVLLNRVGRAEDDVFGYDTNGFDVTFALDGNDIHRYRDLDFTYNPEGALTGTWGADARNVDPGQVVESDVRSRGLDQFTGINPNGNWTLFVADLSAGGMAQLESWGLEIVVVPEPGTLLMTLIFLLAAGLHAWWRRRGRGKVDQTF